MLCSYVFNQLAVGRNRHLEVNYGDLFPHSHHLCDIPYTGNKSFHLIWDAGLLRDFRREGRVNKRFIYVDIVVWYICGA